MNEKKTFVTWILQFRVKYTGVGVGSKLDPSLVSRTPQFSNS